MNLLAEAKLEKFAPFRDARMRRHRRKGEAAIRRGRGWTKVVRDKSKSQSERQYAASYARANARQVLRHARKYKRLEGKKSFTEALKDRKKNRGGSSGDGGWRTTDSGGKIYIGDNPRLKASSGPKARGV